MSYNGIVLVLVCLGFTTMFVPTESAQILAVELIGGKSHWNFMSSIAHSLIKSGHNLTIFAPFNNMDDCNVNCTLIDTSKNVSSTIRNINISIVLNTFSPIVSFMHYGVNFARNSCDIMFENNEIKKILINGRNSGYEILLIEPIVSECASKIATLLEIPVVYIIPSPMVTFMEYSFFGHMPNPATVSHILSHQLTLRTLAQRFKNFAVSIYSLVAKEYHEQIIKKTKPKIYDTIEFTKPSVVFVNSHYISEQSRPLPPNCIPIGGIHLGQPNDIPKDILEFIENSPHGVIYLTFGSVISMSTIPKHIHNAFKEALKQVPQRVLWKYEGQMEDTPENVMTSKWFPQRDILMHPKVKLFISHGGISGVYEAVDAGVPVLGFPLFYDQPRNIDHLVEAGMAISMDLMSVQKDQLLKNVLELLNNDKYMKNAKIASKIFKDRPMSPEQSVVYWTEYVIRHKGAPHLKSPAFNLAWYQYFLLDVIGVVLVSILLAVFIIYKVLKIVFKYFFKNKQQNKVKPE